MATNPLIALKAIPVDPSQSLKLGYEVFAKERANRQAQAAAAQNHLFELQKFGLEQDRFAETQAQNKRTHKIQEGQLKVSERNAATGEANAESAARNADIRQQEFDQQVITDSITNAWKAKQTGEVTADIQAKEEEAMDILGELVYPAIESGNYAVAAKLIQQSYPALDESMARNKTMTIANIMSGNPDKIAEEAAFFKAYHDRRLANKKKGGVTVENNFPDPNSEAVEHVLIGDKKYLIGDKIGNDGVFQVTDPETGETFSHAMPGSPAYIEHHQRKINTVKEANLVLDMVDDALKSNEHPMNSGIGAWLTKNIPGYKSMGQSELLEAIKAKVGFNTLLDLKSAGGNLGQVTNAEHDLMSKAFGSLRIEQDAEKIRTALLTIKRSFMRLREIATGDLKTPLKLEEVKNYKPGQRFVHPYRDIILTYNGGDTE